MPARPSGPEGDVSATWRRLEHAAWHDVRSVSGRPQTFCPLVLRSDPGPRSRELSAYLQRLTDFHSAIPVERDLIPRSIRGAHPVVADDLRATLLLEPARLGRPNTVLHRFEPRPLLLFRHHDGQRMANGRGA